MTCGGAAAVAYWIYGLQASPPQSFWQPPGFVTLAVTALGLMLLLVGFFGPVDREPEGASQSMTAGDHSTNVQAGRDIRLSSHRKETKP